MVVKESVERQVSSRSRPIRIAYLIDLGEKSHAILDAIFDASKRFWGGRFSLIVPCKRGIIRDGYREWLRVYDPDIIYSYVDLTAASQAEIHEQFYPAYLVRHRMWHDEDKVDRHSFRPSLPVAPLSTSTVIPILARRSDYSGERTIKVVSGSGSFAKSPFFCDNFGIELGGIENDLNGRLSEFGGLWMVDDREPDPRIITGRSERVFSTIGELLRTLGRDRRSTTAMRLAAALAPRLECRDRRWSHSFNLIVGDTITDRIVYWNSRFAYPTWRDGDQVDLRVPKADAEDSAFLESLSEFLRELPPVAGDNAGGSPIVTVRSSSIKRKKLEEIRDALTQLKSWVRYEIDTFATVEDCIPTPSRLAEKGGGLRISRGISTGSWHSSVVSGDSAPVEAEPPDHLRHCPPTLQTIHEGLWAVDLSVQRKINYSPHSNTSDTWRLPRRLRTTGAFTGPYPVGLPNGQTVQPRVALGGFLTVFSGARGALPAISEPSDEYAITHALMSGRDWWPFTGFQDERPNQLCYLAERSNAGRYFWGSLQLLGGLHEANGFLLHGYWREQLARFGATDQRPEQRLSDIQTRLKRRLPNGPFNLADDANLTRLANIVAQEADEIRLATPSVPWSKLQAVHERYVQADWEAHPPTGDDVDRDEWQGWERASLTQAVENLCLAGVLHQGVEHSCPRCHHVAWVTIGALDKEIRCDICDRVEPAPVNRPWDFRLNGFLRDALRSHGIGPLFWALSRMRSATSTSFWFEGPLNIYLTSHDYQRHQATTDVDLTVITDGTVRMCEVKQSARQLKRVEEFADLMKRLRPDIATLAIMEPQSKGIKAIFDRFATCLQGTGVKPELITLDRERDLRDQAFLGPTQSYKLL
jgi:hypothetical protein